MTQLTQATADRLADGLAGVCRAGGIPPGDVQDATLVKFTMNAVYRVGGLAVRLSQGPAARTRGEQLVRTMRALTSAGAPVVPLATDLPQPFVHGSWTATAWPWLSTLDDVPHAADLARPLRAFHDATDASAEEARRPSDEMMPDEMVWPDWRPTAKSVQRIEATRGLPPDEYAWTDRWARRETGDELGTLLDWLLDWADDLADRLGHAEWSLPQGLIHGDAHTGNLLRTTDGRALLCDLDGVCPGPREWDLVPHAHGAIRFGRSRADYHDFTAAYGIDITRAECWPLLRDLRELQLVTSVLPGLTGRPAVADQLGHRLRSLQRADRSTVWSRYS